MSSNRRPNGRHDYDDNGEDDFYVRGRPPANYGQGRQPRLSFATPMATPMSPFDSEEAVNSRDASFNGGGLRHGDEHRNGVGSADRGDSGRYSRHGEDERPSNLRGGGGVKATPNSLTQSTGGPANSSRAERKLGGGRVGSSGNVHDRIGHGNGRGNSSSSLKSGGNSIGKTPNSLVDSRGPTTTRAETKGDDHYYNRGRGDMPSRTNLPPSSSQQRSRSADRFDAGASSSSSFAPAPNHKHTKSYVERYHDIKRMSMKDRNEHDRESNHPRHSHHHNAEADTSRRSSHDRRSSSAGGRNEGPPNRFGRNASPISAKYRNDAYAPPVPPPPPRPRGGNPTSSSADKTRPPVNRYHDNTRDSNQNNGRNARMMMSPQNSTRTDQTVSPTSRASSFATERSSRTQTSSESPSSAHINRWSPQRNTYDDYDQYEASEYKNQDGYDYDDDRRYHSPESRPDPAGEPNPYDIYPNSDPTNNSNAVERSPLFEDVEEEPGTGSNLNIGHNSPLSIDHRFEDEGASTASTYADNLKSFSERITGVVSGNVGGSGDVSRREDKRLIHHQDSRDLYGRQQQQKMQETSRYHDYDGNDRDGNRQSPHQYDDRNDQSDFQDDGGNTSSPYQEKRVRWGAADFCKRFTEPRRRGDGGEDGTSRNASNHFSHRRDPDRNRRNTWKASSRIYDNDLYQKNGYGDYDRENPMTVASLEKSKRTYLLMALTVCVACIVAVAVTVTYFKGESNGEPSVAASYITLAPTPSPTTSRVPSDVPSETHSEVPSSSPTERPTTERERLIGEFLQSLSGGDSNIPGTPQYRAKMWLLFEDEMNLHLSQYDAKNGWTSDVAERIEQRFALATLYYSMGVGEGRVAKGWLEGDECRNVGDYGWAWDGVACTEDGKVRALALGMLVVVTV